MAAATAMGGRNDPGFALWRAHAAKESWLHCDCRTHPGARHRHQRRYLLSGGRRAAAPLALSKSRPAGQDLEREPGYRSALSRDLVSRLPAIQAAVARFRG